MSTKSKKKTKQEWQNPPFIDDHGPEFKVWYQWKMGSGWGKCIPRNNDILRIKRKKSKKPFMTKDDC